MTPQQELDIARTQLYTHLCTGLEKIHQLKALRYGEEYPYGPKSSNELLCTSELVNLIERWIRHRNDNQEGSMCQLERYIESLIYLFEELQYDWDMEGSFGFMRCVPSRKTVENHMDRYRNEGRFWEKDSEDETENKETT